MEKETGGAAFPTSHSKDYPSEISGGMTLRDWFAGRAMQGELASQTPGTADDIYTTTAGDCKDLAEWCYQMADAMLAARAA